MFQSYNIALFIHFLDFLNDRNYIPNIQIHIHHRYLLNVLGVLGQECYVIRQDLF